MDSDQQPLTRDSSEQHGIDPESTTGVLCYTSMHAKGKKHYNLGIVWMIRAYVRVHSVPKGENIPMVENKVPVVLSLKHAWGEREKRKRGQEVFRFIVVGQCSQTTSC